MTQTTVCGLVMGAGIIVAYNWPPTNAPSCVCMDETVKVEFMSVPSPSSPNGMNFTIKLHNNKSNSCITGEPLVLLIKRPSV